MVHVDEEEDDDCGVSLGSKIWESKKINSLIQSFYFNLFVP
jgi:hypothetical protein